jgi:hypothetical protein
MLEVNTKAISRVLEAARRKLLETGTRNRLIHVNRANQRANCLNVINERSEDIFALLRVQAKRMRFKAMGKDKVEDGQEMLLSLSSDDREPGADRYGDNFIETPLGPEALARRLLRLAHDAKTAEEEQGLNILYLAMGFLRWRESPTSEIQREAPLVLIPVQLVRNERTSTFDILSRDDDITTNLPLQERLRQDFGIVLPEIEESEEWSPSRYFELVADAVSGQPSWLIDADGMQIGFFSFAKLLMHRDLDQANWPDGMLADNDLLAGLLADGFEADTPFFGPEDKLDDHLDPAQIIQVVDADASQTKVIEEVRRGASLVVQGPPGTGKSQTITNIIAAAAHDGKSVLFVAEKMAALSVVHDRLVKSGLRDICLELHSRTANKKALAQELGRTLMASARALPGATDPEQLRLTRDELNRITALLHTRLSPSNESPFQAISEIIGFIGKGAKAPSISEDGLEALTQDARQRALAAISGFVAALETAGSPEAHPFRGTMNLDLQPTDLVRLENELAAATKSISELRGAAGQVARALHQPEPTTLTEIATLGAGLEALAAAPAGAVSSIAALFPNVDQARQHEALQAGVNWARVHAAAAPKFAAAAWGAGLGSMRQAIARGQTSFFARLFGPYRRASGELASLLSGPLPKAPAERLALVDELAEVQNRRKNLADEESWLQATLGAEWRGERTPFATLLEISDWLADIKRSEAFSEADHVTKAITAFSDPLAAARDIEVRIQASRVRMEAPITRLQLDLAQAEIGDELETTPLSEIAAAFEQMAADTGRYGDWATLARSVAAATGGGAGAIVTAIDEERITPSEARREFAYACAEARWNAARAARPELNELPRLDRHDLVQLFRKLEKDRIDTAKTLILSRHFEQMPRGTMGEMGIIRGEVGRKRGHKSIRWVMKNAGSMVQRIKPVMLMSPISVAQFLPPGSVVFDLLVIDEASQIRPEDALGVVARARQIVVVGDQKQLPPTSFFDRLVDDVEDIEDEDEDAPIGATAADMESILSLCEARGLRSRMLEWHYRSRDPSLIRVSNAEFYRDELVLPPSPLQLDDDYGLKFHRVPGVYARGGSGLGRQGTNRIEAQAVVRGMADHARAWPDLSLGVVAFSKAQADMLTELLELERRQDPVLDSFLREGRHEDVFVKNIENVQGDERDVILISVGYGPQEANGRLASMSFGPVNGEGGERRLNVLFSRARVRCEVFASFDPGDIDPARSKREGPRVLKRFLDFAKTGIMEERAVSGLDADSPFEEDVAAAIRSLGYLADPQVGTAGFRIDLGVRHPDRPGQYLLAVECDGAAYHAALWARERDRLRQDVLENLGWHFHRIWSTDWFHHRSQEIQRLSAALNQARLTVRDGIRVRGANDGAVKPTVVAQDAAPELIEIDHLALSAPLYVRAELSVRSNLEPHEAPIAQLADLVVKVVEIEGPIHIDEVARRITSAFGKSRAGNRIVEATGRAARLAAQRDRTLRREGPFLLTETQAEDPPIRDRADETGSLLKASYLPPMEIAAAAYRIRSESGDMPAEDLIRAVARLLGFQRVGSDLAEVIDGALG